MNEIENISTIELIKDLNIIQKKLKLYLEKEYIIKQELIRRIPTLANDHVFTKETEMEVKHGKTKN